MAEAAAPRPAPPAPLPTPASPEQVFAELAAMGLPRTPRVYEVWYAYRAERNEAVSRAIEARSARGPISLQDIEEVHEAHCRDDIAARQAERSGQAIAMEIDAIADLVKLAMGSTNQYSQSLSQLLRDLISTNDPLRLKSVVEALVSATEEVKSANEALERRLRASRNEIEELRRVLEATRLETLTDALTGISNRKHFDQTLQTLVEQSRTTRRPFTLLMIDIDHFKQFNDLHGHLTGDKVLKIVAQTLRAKFPNRATVARFGGEEFAVLLPDSDLMSGWIGAEAARQTILARELVKRSTGEKIGRIMVSVGISAYRTSDSPFSLIARADRALIVAKANGRNQTVTEDQAVETAAAVA